MHHRSHPLSSESSDSTSVSLKSLESRISWIPSTKVLIFCTQPSVCMFATWEMRFRKNIPTPSYMRILLFVFLIFTNKACTNCSVHQCILSIPYGSAMATQIASTRYVLHANNELKSKYYVWSRL